MKCIRCIPSSEKRCRWYNFLVAPVVFIAFAACAEAVLNGIIAEVEYGKRRMFYAYFWEHSVLEESVANKYISDIIWCARNEASNHTLQITLPQHRNCKQTYTCYS